MSEHKVTLNRASMLTLIAFAQIGPSCLSASTNYHQSLNSLVRPEHLVAHFPFDGDTANAAILDSDRQDGSKVKGKYLAPAWSMHRSAFNFSCNKE